MRRIDCRPRPDAEARLAALGVDIDAHAQSPYWREDAAYVLSEDEVETLHAAVEEIERLVMAGVAHVIEHGLTACLAIPGALVPSIEASWAERQPSLYGRFDIRFDGQGPPKLLEYNADTPTALFEASVVQWHWLGEVHPGADQYNAIHERLIEAWQARRAAGARRVHFACMPEDDDDLLTTCYLQDVAHQAGLDTRFLEVPDIGHDGRDFIDLHGGIIETLFKLYPWEWLAAEPFFELLARSRMRLIEPAWRLVASSKGLLAVLWELFPGHPNLLPAALDPAALEGPAILKPMLGREGAGILVETRGIATEGPFGTMPRVAQAFEPLPSFGGWHPVLGVWTVAGAPCGLGIREDRSLVTGRGARFVPHLME